MQSQNEEPPCRGVAFKAGGRMPESLIQSNPSVMMGKPTVAGTRVTVELILDKLGAGESIEQILEAHPRLSRQSVLAAVRFGAAALRADVAYPVAEPVS